MSEQEPARCQWRMPEEAKGGLAGAQCVADEGHDCGHVMWQAVGSRALWLYEVQIESRLMTPVLHADFRGGSGAVTEEDARAFWQVTTWFREHDGASQSD